RERKIGFSVVSGEHQIVVAAGGTRYNDLAVCLKRDPKNAVTLARPWVRYVRDNRAAGSEGGIGTAVTIVPGESQAKVGITCRQEFTSRPHSRSGQMSVGSQGVGPWEERCAQKSAVPKSGI